MRIQEETVGLADMPSTTVSTEGLILLCMIYTMEGRYVATSDIPGAFLHTNYYKGDIHIKLEGAVVALL